MPLATAHRPIRWDAWRAELSATLALGWPLILANVAQTALTTADVVLMGWLGPAAVAAGALGTNLYFAFMIFGVGLVSATAPLIAQELGRNRRAVHDVRRTVRQGFWAAVAVAVPIWIVLWQAEAILLALGQEPALAAAAGPYVRALQWALLPFLLSVVLRSFLAALERPMWALAVGLSAVPVNVALAWWLMFGGFGMPALGLVGIGIATSLASVFMLAGLAAVVLLDRKFRRYALFGRFWRADPPRFRKLLRIGLPIGATLLFEVTVFNAAAFLMGLFGAQALAAHAIALQIAAMTFMVPLGLSQAVTVRVGLAFGARDDDGVGRAGWTAYGLGVGFMALMALAMVTFPHALVGVFLDRADPANAPVIELAVTFLAFAALFQVVDGAQAVGAGMLRGLNDTRIPMLYAAFGYWAVGGALGVVLAFGTSLAGKGIWIGLATGLAVVAALMLARWLRRRELGLLDPVGSDAARAQPIPA
jgi:multidrug resistance protein, MATE family